MKIRSYSLDVLKLILALCVVALHYNWKIIPRGYLAVEFFFIISGFSFYRFNGMKPVSPIKIAKKIYVPYLISIFMILVFSNYSYDFKSIIISILMMQSLGFNDVVINVPTWFLCVYTFVSPCIIFIYGKLKNNNIKVEYVLLLIPIIIYIMLRLNTPSSGLNFSLEFKILGVTVGIFRCIAAVCVGLFTAIICDGVRVGRDASGSLLISLVVGFVYIFSFSGYSPEYDYISIPMMSLFIILLSNGNDLISSSLELVGKKIKFAGIISTYIFLFHFPVIVVLNEGGDNRLTKLSIMMSIFVVFILLRGVFSYSKIPERQ